ncbi:HAD family hydrolase [Patescibacteria group bacterium]|nr:HAD family hydrolase [Patescibacteria group bacterium]
MRYKAVIFDLDGTAIPHAIDAHPSHGVIRAIARAQPLVRISASTSRPASFARRPIVELGLRDLCSVNDATDLYDPLKDRVIASIHLSESAAAHVRDILNSSRIPYMVNVGSDEYMADGRAETRQICALLVPEITGDKADRLIGKLSGISDIAAVKCPSYKEGLLWLAVTDARATKLHTVISIAEYYRIRPEEIIGIGDGYNDYPLLSACGLKVAMGNAVAELKAIADVIAPPVEEDGVAWVLERYVRGSHPVNRRRR